MTNTEQVPAAESCFGEDGQWAWDSVSLGAYMTCPIYYRYKIVEGWGTRELSVHLKFGQLYASALEHYFKHLVNGLGEGDALREVVRELLVETWEYGYATPADAEAKRNPLPGTGHPWQSGHTSKTRENLVRTVVWYFDQFKDDPCSVVILEDGKPAVELSFRLEIDPGLLWCGHIDRLVEYGGEKYVMDQKTTTGTIGTYWFNQWETESQFLGYTLAGQIIYDLPLKGVIVDAAQIAVGFSRFERGFIHYTAAQLEEWLDHSLAYIARAQSDFQSGEWLMNRKSCNNYGGCPFRRVCATDPALRDRFMRAEYVQGPGWNPLESR